MNYIKIDTEDVCNGDGLRVVLWLLGCSRHCYNCQNPQTWDTNSGISFDESAKKELFRELNKDYISGLTLTGGDPLHEANLDGVFNLVNRIRLSFRNSKTIWLYTGFTFKELMKYEYGNTYLNNFNVDVLRQIIVSKVDVLVDGPYIDSQRDITLKWRGSQNQRVIDVQKSIQKGKVVLWTA